MQLLILTFSIAALALACDKGATPSNGTARQAPGATHEAAAQEATTKARPTAPAQAHPSDEGNDEPMDDVDDEEGSATDQSGADEAPSDPVDDSEGDIELGN